MDLSSELALYDIDVRRGFLPARDPLHRLPPEFEVWESAAANVPAWLMNGRARHELGHLPIPDLSCLVSREEWERAMLLLSLFGNTTVWGGPNPTSRLAQSIAVPWWQVAQHLGRPPIVAHASLVLQNWRRMDTSRPVSLDNIDSLVLFLGGSDERWFYLVTVAIEAAGAPALGALWQGYTAAKNNQVGIVAESLATISTALQEMLLNLLRMPEQCDPYIFYHRIRPYLSSWPDEGLIYEGVDETPRHYTGGSAAQSSLIQALDISLGVKHTSPFLLAMRDYMPPPHRQFLSDLEARPSIREFVVGRQAQEPQLARVFNDCINLLDEFRRVHMEYSVRYIIHQAPDMERATGTGGTNFVQLLSKARKDTQQSHIDTQSHK